MDEGPDAFLSRWSKRKARAREGSLPDDAPAAPAAPTAPGVAAGAAASPACSGGEESPGVPPPPTLRDVSLLTRDSDFSRFVAPGVGGDVRNAALRKLFADPHFNLMDGLDTYIDDYGKPDPLPLEQLRRMAQAQFLGLFEQDDPACPAPGDAPEVTPDENPDLRLQPHDAAGRPGPEPGADEDPRRLG